MPRHAEADNRLIIHSDAPYNAEPTLGRLRRSFFTAQADFYVRSHGNVPQLDEHTHRLRVGGHVAAPLDLTVEDLRRQFAHATVAAVIQCAGNRRADMHRVRPTLGEPWASGAIGNAEWTGVALADVLRAAGSREDARLHVGFQSEDVVEMPQEGAFKYGVSIPMAKAISPEVLLVFEMNGEPLTAKHGHPLRVVAPGFAGVRSPKWLSRITVQDAASANHMQQRDYKLLPSHVTPETVDWDKGITIDEMPLNSAICEPAAHAELPAGPMTLRGYAVATARRVVRVDVSCDGGRTWAQAELEPAPHAPWSWTFWHAELDLPTGEHELAVRAWDSAGQTQPALPDDTWNFKGYLSAAWHRIAVRVS